MLSNLSTRWPSSCLMSKALLFFFAFARHFVAIYSAYYFAAKGFLNSSGCVAVAPFPLYVTAFAYHGWLFSWWLHQSNTEAQNDGSKHDLQLQKNQFYYLPRFAYNSFLLKKILKSVRYFDFSASRRMRSPKEFLEQYDAPKAFGGAMRCHNEWSRSVVFMRDAKSYQAVW